MDERTQRQLEMRLKRIERKAVHFRMGRVTNLDPLSVALGGAEEEYVGVASLGVALEVDDLVPCLKWDGDLLILGGGVTSLLTLGTAATKDVPASGDASPTQVVKGNDSRLTDSRPPADGVLVNLLQGLANRVHVNGHSGAKGVGAIGQHGFGQRLAALIKCAASNSGVGGAVMSWDGVSNTDGSGDGGYARVLQDTSAGSTSISKPDTAAIYRSSIPYLAWAVGEEVLALLYGGFNDAYLDCAGGSGNLAQSNKAMIHAMRRMISALRSARRIEDESFVAWNGAGTSGYGANGDVAGSYGGWSATTNATRNSGSRYGQTSTVGDFIEYVTPTDLSQDSVVAFGGIVLSGEAGTITFKCDGNTVGTIALADVASPTAGKYTGFCFRFGHARGLTKSVETTGNTTNGSAVITSIPDTTGMNVGQPVLGSGIPTGAKIQSINSGTQITLTANATATASGVVIQTAHVLRATFTAKTGSSIFRFDSWDIESPIPSPVVVMNIVRPYASGLYNFSSSVSDRDAKIGTMNGLIEALCDEFEPYSGLPNCVLYCDHDAVINKQADLFYPVDNLHESDEGYGASAATVFRTLRDYLATSRDLDAAGASA